PCDLVDRHVLLLGLPDQVPQFAQCARGLLVGLEVLAGSLCQVLGRDVHCHSPLSNEASASLRVGHHCSLPWRLLANHPSTSYHSWVRGSWVGSLPGVTAPRYAPVSFLWTVLMPSLRLTLTSLPPW